MFDNNGYNQYKQNSINTATPGELTLMLFNGLVKFIMQGQNGIDEKNTVKSHDGIIRAEDILTELRATLDLNYEIAKYLDSLYEYMHRRLIQANIKKDKEILEEVLGMAKELRDTWAQAMKLAKQQVKTQEAIAK